MLKGLKLDPEFLESENIIAKLQLLMQLEKNSPYAKGTMFDPLPKRILRALKSIPDESQQYVLALFANTIYCTEQFSATIMLHLYSETLRDFDITHQNFPKDCLVLEVDPTGMINDFLRLNRVQGRLDKVSFQRAQQLDDFVNKVNLQKGLADFVQGKCRATKRKIAELVEKARLEDYDPWLKKTYWIVLVDNALSGTSLCSALRRLNTLALEFGDDPTIILLIRTLAHNAEALLEEKFKTEITNRKIIYKYGLLLKEDYAINPEKTSCSLFNNDDTYQKIIEACKWLADQSWYQNDPILKDHKDSSGDNMIYGFKKCGLTFVSAENCPSNSLPLLWYKRDGYYSAPFPRVLSRVGGNQHVQTSDS